MKLPRPATRVRRYAAAAGSLALAGALAMSGLVTSGSIEETLAQQSDDEYSTASVAAEWPEAFVSVVAGSARSATSMINASFDMTYQSQFRWTSQLSQPAVTPGAEDTSGWATRNRIWDERYQGAGVAVDDWAIGTANNLGDLDTSTWALHDGKAVREFTNPGDRVLPSNFRCLVIDESFGNASNRADCGMGSNFAAAQNTTDAIGFSIGTGLTQFTYLNAAQLSTAVRCGLDSATADRPSGRIDFGQEASLGGQGNQNLLYNSNARTVWTNGFGQLDNGGNFPPAENTLSDMWTVQNILGVSTHAKVMPVITQHASTNGSQPYALSEVGAYIEVYRRAAALSPIVLHAKMYFVLSRSECGVKRVSDTALPTQRAVFPSTLPGGDGLTPYSGIGFQPAVKQAQSVAARGLHLTDATTRDLPPATTTPTVTEDAIASETTAFGPPSLDDADESASNTRASQGRSKTSTSPTSVSETTPVTSNPSATPTTTTPASTIPATAIPRAPGTLSPTARLEDVETITVGEEDLVVVIEGDTVPTDARRGATALEIWLSGGDPGTTWATFASDAPDEDGWRWAAINQKTGTVVHIR